MVEIIKHYMIRLITYLTTFLLVISCVASSCSNQQQQQVVDDTNDDAIFQNDNGVLSLSIKDAACYSDIDDPSENTAEWGAVIRKSGRYDVWLSSLTTDTTTLNYKNPVCVTFRDISIAKIPHCDVILSGKDDSFRADSFLGSVYIQDTGYVDIQVICEKIIPAKVSIESDDNDISLFTALRFTPEVKRAY